MTGPRRALPPAGALAQADRLTRARRVLDVTPAARPPARGMPPCVGSRCQWSVVITEDAPRGRTLEGVRRLNPFTPECGPARRGELARSGARSMVPQAVRRYLEAVQATPPEAVWAGVPGLAPGVHHFVPLPASSTGPARNTEWGSPVRYRFDPRIFNDETTDRIGAHLIDLEEPDVWEFGPPPSGLDQEWWSLPGAVRAAVAAAPWLTLGV